jgi:hypothetical protein
MFHGALMTIRPLKVTQTPPLIRVCAWHTPKPEIDRLNQQHPGQITHGMCPTCAAKFLREVA